MRQSEADGVSHCDLVMKGGVTSGVIYPRLVAGLSDRYRFKNIGGTSAGAIAAGASAAAELGRQRGHAGAFERLARLPEELGAVLPGARPGPGRSRLFTLFQPVPALRRHFDVLTRALGKPAGAAAISVLVGMVAMHGVAVLAMAAVGAALLVPYLQFLASDGSAGPWQKLLAVVGLAMIVALVSAAMLGTVLALFARSLLRGLKDNGYGLCSGLTQPDQGARGERGGSGEVGGQTALTDWLHVYFNELAGKSFDGPPLSFGDLWGPDPATRRINLEVITSAVSQQMVYSIPFRPGTPMFYYDPTEWSLLFPPAVMAALAAPFDGSYDGPVIESAQGRALRSLPRHGDLPVVVAIRMSLSFPLLLSAVPLYAVDWSRTANQRTQAEARAAATAAERRRLRLRATRIWFSDGGIGSNMPLHLFDAMLPRHPTFAVNLKAPHPDHVIRPEDPGNDGGRIYLPEDDRGGRLRYWPEPDLVDGWEHRPAEAREKAPLAGLAGFLWSIVGTMQNWRDEILFPTPGFRDRIVQISQRADEGGLNLAMPAGTIVALAEAGGMAAQRLVARFHPLGVEGGAGWDSHRRARLTTFLGVMQPATVGLTSAMGARPGTGVGTAAEERDGTAADWLVLLDTDARYKRSSALRAEAARFLTGLDGLGAATPRKFSGQPRTLDVGSLKPIPQVRLTPRI
ncbi:patatin-like phospholipase family protein [Mitsuaria sp. 7]|uniref:patatin-like phospholipase family protein n=1 Tax=Mitsuaria sp. 7 TaxID=1658665 RepID=UPI0009ECC8BA|nr:patatin-like phospholipase family protein [Mitsuaria sp. 7]